MIIKELSSNKDELAWDEFVSSTSNATFFHQIGWKKLVEKCYKYKPIYLMAKEAGEINGILPLFLVKNIFLGKRLISVPFAIAGGVCTNNTTATNILIDKAIELTKNFGCIYLELRNLEEENFDNLVKKGNYFNFRVRLNSDHQTLWKGLRPTNRRYIRKAQRNNLDIILHSKEFQQFYHVYSRGQRNLGTPIQAYEWLENLFFEFPDNHSIAMAIYNGKTVAAFLVRYFKNTVTYIFGYSLEEYRRLYPNYILIWELCQHACRNGYEWFDLGRSVKSSGTYFFKEGWSAKPVQLNYQYYLNKPINIPDTSQENPRRRLFSKIWKTLPVPLANTLGPVIRRRYP
ncbi:MAG: FemAB family XrtA/PEP-CTERM system-associated protein [Candidatus Hodarchaeota archaeon]